MQVTFSGIGGRTALVPQKNGVRTPSWAFNSNLKFTCKMSLDSMQDVRITETPITRALTWEDEQPAPAAVAGNLNYTANATATLTGLPVPVISLKTCNGAPGQFKNGFYFTVTSDTHGKCFLIAYLHLGGLLVRPSVKSFKNNAVLVHTEMCGYDNHSVSVDIKIPETSSIHKAGPRYSSTHPAFSIKFILWGQDGLIKTMHESMPLYSYAKDPDQVNCQYFSPNPSGPLSNPANPSSGNRDRSLQLHRGHESPPPSPPQLAHPLLAGATTPNPNTNPTTTPISPTNATSPLASLSSTMILGSTAAAISIPMDSFKSLVAYIQKLERQVEMQQQQLETARQQEELQHRLISQLAQDIKFKSFQCEVLEEKLQQLSGSSHTTHTTQTPTGDNLLTPNHQLISLNPIMNPAGSPSSSHLSHFAYPTTPSTTANSTAHMQSNSGTSLPAFSYTTSSSSLTPISHLSMPLSSQILITNPLTANLATASTATTTSTPITTTTTVTPNAETSASTTSKTESINTTTSSTTTSPTPTNSTPVTVPTPTQQLVAENVPAQQVHASAAQTQPQENIAAQVSTHDTSSAPSSSTTLTNEKVGVSESGGEKDRATEPMKAEQEQEVRDFLTQMQKKQKQDGFDNVDSEVKRQRT